MGVGLGLVFSVYFRLGLGLGFGLGTVPDLIPTRKYKHMVSKIRIFEFSVELTSVGTD